MQVLARSRIGVRIKMVPVILHRTAIGWWSQSSYIDRLIQVGSAESHGGCGIDGQVQMLRPATIMNEWMKVLFEMAMAKVLLCSQYWSAVKIWYHVLVMLKSIAVEEGWRRLKKAEEGWRRLKKAEEGWRRASGLSWATPLLQTGCFFTEVIIYI